MITLTPIKKRILIVVAAAVGVYLLALLLIGNKGILTKLKMKEGLGTDESSSSNRSSTNRSSSNRTSGSTNLVPFPVRWGHDTRYSNVDVVLNLQKVCYYCGAKIAMDGVWGKETEAAIGRLREAKISTVSDAGYDQITTTVQPFKPYIKPVVNPSNSQSRWQVSTLQDYEAIVKMYNTYVKNRRNANIL